LTFCFFIFWLKKIKKCDNITNRAIQEGLYHKYQFSKKAKFLLVRFRNINYNRNMLIFHKKNAYKF